MSQSLVHALSGSIGGAASMALTYPLEQVRTLVQAGELDLSKMPSKYSNMGSTVGRICYVVLEQGGVRVLYQGCTAVVETVAISNFLYFYMLQYSRQILHARLPSLSPTQLTLASSTVAAAVNIAVTEPLWRANTRIKTLPPSELGRRNLWSVLIEMVKTDGVQSLWKGTPVSLWLISNPIIQFSAYEYLKRIYLKNRKSRAFTPLHAFLFGAISKAIATAVTYPLQVAQTRLRVAAKQSPRSAREGVADILLRLYAEQGIEGLFHGWSAKLTQTVLTAAFMFAFYERFALMLGRLIARA